MKSGRQGIEPAAGMVWKVFLRPAPKAEVVEVESARAIAGQGLEGDHAHGGSRQVTLLSLEAWQAALAELKADVSPACRRANLVVSGTDLRAAIGQEVEIGDVVIRVKDYNPPCIRMESSARGLMHALHVDQRAGVFGVILRGGWVRPGMPVRIVPTRWA
ncbi:MAG: MOSC domain-containing protein [Planctomycetes bacterium]|nr:MOSC domain-containing protein [Planctomycetota bacterium]